MAEGADQSALPEPWQAALSGVDRDLSARGAAERTRRAYGADAAQLAAWAAEAGLAPAELGHRQLRRYAAHLGERGCSRSTVGRKLAAIGALYDSLIRSGEVAANPAELVSSPKRDSHLPRVLTRDEVASMLDRIP